jgi:hypothetical protein
LRTHNQQAIYHHLKNTAVCFSYANLINLPMSFHKVGEKVLLCLPPTNIVNMSNNAMAARLAAAEIPLLSSAAVSQPSAGKTVHDEF